MAKWPSAENSVYLPTEVCSRTVHVCAPVDEPLWKTTYQLNGPTRQGHGTHIDWQSGRLHRRTNSSESMDDGGFDWYRTPQQLGLANNTSLRFVPRNMAGQTGLVQADQRSSGSSPGTVAPQDIDDTSDDGKNLERPLGDAEARRQAFYGQERSPSTLTRVYERQVHRRFPDERSASALPTVMADREQERARAGLLSSYDVDVAETGDAKDSGVGTVDCSEVRSRRYFPASSGIDPDTVLPVSAAPPTMEEAGNGIAIPCHDHEASRPRFYLGCSPIFVSGADEDPQSFA